MVSEEKAIGIINKYLQRAHETNIRRYFPVVASQLYGNGQLCEQIIDHLGDIYTCAGLDADHAENACGAEIQEAITFLAFCNGKAKRRVDKMKKPLVIRPARGLVVISAILATLCLVYLVMLVFLKVDHLTSLFFLLVALVLMAISLWYYSNSLTTIAFFDDGVFVLKNGRKATYDPWSKYTQVRIAHNYKGYPFIVLASEQVDKNVFMQVHLRSRKMPRGEYLMFCLGFVHDEDVRLLKEMIGEKVGEIVEPH